MDDTTTGPGPRVLVVRDADAERQTIEANLQQAGFQTVAASDRKQAIEQAADIDLVLLDRRGQTGTAGTNCPVCLTQAEPAELIRALAEASVELADVSRGLIEATLDLTSGNRARAARRLGISERTIYNKVKRFAADPT